MNDWEELKELMQGLPRASDMYNQVVGDAVVAVDRGIKELEASLEICSQEILRLEKRERELKAKNEDLMKLAGMYIKSYEELAFGKEEE